GVIYYLQILASNTITQKFILRPLTLADNDECSGARLYELGDTINLSVDSTLQSRRQCVYSDSKAYDRWYHFTGKDSVVSLDITAYTINITGPSLSVLTGDCEDPVCEPLTQLGNQFSFMGSAGQDYWLNISNAAYY